MSGLVGKVIDIGGDRYRVLAVAFHPVIRMGSSPTWHFLVETSDGQIREIRSEFLSGYGKEIRIVGDEW
ncbi:MAG: hypothetical protein E6Q97_12335 [Desulfurellales bacterium]|nr:MAG: hypothetical protein E6Q97_12335 [Desulfurellales bacterium]